MKYLEHKIVYQNGCHGVKIRSVAFDGRLDATCWYFNSIKFHNLFIGYFISSWMNGFCCNVRIPFWWKIDLDHDIIILTFMMANCSINEQFEMCV